MDAITQHSESTEISCLMTAPITFGAILPSETGCQKELHLAAPLRRGHCFHSNLCVCTCSEWQWEGDAPGIEISSGTSGSRSTLPSLYWRFSGIRALVNDAQKCAFF